MNLKGAEKRKDSAPRSLVERTRSFILDRVGRLKGKTVTAGFSGGADSTALVHVFHALSKEMGFTLVAMHLNHKLRGKESLRDESFARKFCRERKLRFISARRDVARLAREKRQNLEEAARLLRREFFSSCAARLKSSYVFLAHTRGDQAETVLMRLLRGTGLRGAGGMEEVSREGDLFFVRPFLGVEKEDLLGYLREKGLTYVEDSSNADLTFTRNRVRRRVLPVLEKESPHLRERLVSFASLCRDAARFFEAEHERLFQDYLKESERGICISEEIFSRYPFSVALAGLRAQMEKTFAGRMNPDRRPLEQGLCAMMKAEAGKQFHLRGGLILLKGRKVIYVLPGSELERKEKKIILKTGRCDKFFDWTLGLCDSSKGVPKETPPYEESSVREAFLSGRSGAWAVPFPERASRVVVRSFEIGDRAEVILKGKNHTKKVQDLLVNAKIPLFLKKRLPVLESGGKIIFIPGVFLYHGPAETVRKCRQKRYLYLSWKKGREKGTIK